MKQTRFETSGALNTMGEQAVPQLWFKPGTFWRHYSPTIGNIKQLLNAHRVQTECHLHFAGADPPFEFSRAPDPTYKINTFVGSLVFNAQNFIEYVILQYGYIQYTNRIVFIGAWFCFECIPLVVQVYP